jgi:hypothetical protein
LTANFWIEEIIKALYKDIGLDAYAKMVSNIKRKVLSEEWMQMYAKLQDLIEKNGYVIESSGNV